MTRKRTPFALKYQQIVRCCFHMTTLRSPNSTAKARSKRSAWSSQCTKCGCAAIPCDVLRRRCSEWSCRFCPHYPPISGHSFPTGSRWFWRLLQQKPKPLKQTGGREGPRRGAGSTRINISIQWRILHVDWRVLLVTAFWAEVVSEYDYDQESSGLCSAKRNFGPGPA